MAPFPYAAIIENGAIKKGAILNGASHLQHHLNMTPYGARSIRPPWRHLRHMAPFSVFAKWKMAMRHFYLHQRHLMALFSGARWRSWRHMARKWRHFRAIFLSDTIAVDALYTKYGPSYRRLFCICVTAYDAFGRSQLIVISSLFKSAYKR